MNQRNIRVPSEINRRDFLKLSGVGLVGATLLGGCGGGQDSGGGETYNWRLGFNTSEDSVRDIAAQRFKETVEEGSNGRITIEIFPAEALGSEQEMLDSVQVGSLDMQMAGGGAMSNQIPEYATLALPFMVETFDEAYAVLDGPIGDDWKALAEEQGYKVLSHHDLGFAQITNNVRPTESPDDLQGVTMRSPEEPVSVTTFETLGASVSTLAFTEVYPGLQQGVIDGQFNPLDAIYESNFHEVQDYLSMLNIFYYHVNFIMNADLWNGLDPELQEVVQRAADESQEVSRQTTQENEQEMRETLQGEFVEITENPDRQAFQEAVQSAYPQFEEIISAEAISETQQFIEDYRAENQ